jgi:thiosulfate reductase cytochrome b subunit
VNIFKDLNDKGLGSSKPFSFAHFLLIIINILFPFNHLVVGVLSKKGNLPVCSMTPS